MHTGLSRLSAAPALDTLSATAAGSASNLAVLMRVGVIRNPTSHRNKGCQVEAEDDPRMIVAAPRTKTELEAALARFAREKIGLLVIDGGDGTVRDVLSRAAPVFGDSWPRIIVLPKGKTNALAVDLGLPDKWPLSAALNAAARGRTVKRRPIAVERLDAEQRRRFGFILGAGVFNAAIDAGQVAHRYGAFQSFAVGVTGLFGVLQALFGIGESRWRKISRMRVLAGPERQAIVDDGRNPPAGRFLAGISTLTTFPLGLRPFASAGSSQAINYLVVDAPLRRAVALLPALLFGGDFAFLPRLGIHRGATSELWLDLEDSFILDGEAFPPGRYHLKLGPELQFVVP